VVKAKASAITPKTIKGLEELTAYFLAKDAGVAQRFVEFISNQPPKSFHARAIRGWRERNITIKQLSEAGLKSNGTFAAPPERGFRSNRGHWSKDD
jgi:hypothetical protein